MTKRGSLLQRLRRNQSGNVAYITAGLFVPMLALVGSGVDLGRAYMARTRLQQACDAGVLAGRKVMAEGVWDSEAATAANNMFNFNFPSGIYQSRGVMFAPRQISSSEVTARAGAVVDTMIMYFFGKRQFELTVTCTAKLEISNADIMFVLDSTGSMSYANSGDSVTKIAALKTEVMSFFDTLASAQQGSSIIRYGVVPYSSNVNVGRVVYAKNPDYISTRLDIPSRTGEWVTTVNGNPVSTWTESSGFSSWTNTGSTINKTSVTCANTAPNPQYVDGSVQSGPTTTNNAVVSQGSGTQTPDYRTVTLTTDTYYNSTKYRYYYTSSACRLQQSSGIRRERATETDQQRYDYTYQDIDYDVSNVLNGSGMVVSNGRMGAEVTASWNGCILERDTNPFDDNVATIPTDAYDLDVDTVPSREELRWHISLPNMTYTRPNSNSIVTSARYSDFTGNAPCPTQAMKLTPMTSANRSALQTYVNTLIATGNTYHDVGMIWGTRFISPTGIFADENAAAPNGMPISRHIIFMTDGQMEPNASTLSFQGVEFLMGRVGAWSNTTELTNRHNRRFLEACAAATSRNITVWVVSFGTSLTTNLKNCASGDKAYQANNAAQLHQQFQSIAQQITRLRLSQ